MADHRSSFCVTENIGRRNRKKQGGETAEVCECSPPPPAGEKKRLSTIFHPRGVAHRLGAATGSRSTCLHVPCHTQLRYCTCCSYLERRFVAGERLILLLSNSVHGCKKSRTPVCGRGQSPVIPHRMLHTLSMEKIKARHGHMVVRFNTRYRCLGAG